MSIHARRSRRGLRAFSVAEMVIVVCVCAVVAAVAILSLSSASSAAKRAQDMKAVYTQLQQIRARHLAITGGPDACLFLKRTSTRTLDSESRMDCTQANAAPTVNRLATTLILVRDACVDSLGRGAQCNNLQALEDITFAVETDGTPPTEGMIVWGANGQLVANFPVDSTPDGDAQAHLSDVGAAVTPEPTAVGTYGGAPTNPRGLLQ